jgi:hypothetical protein
MAERSNSNPHITDKNSSLQALSMQALRRFGDFHPGTVDGDVLLMFIEFANLVIDEIRMHPYHDGSEINYYESVTDVRPIDDNIIVSGLLFHYAAQQGSEKMQMYVPSLLSHAQPSTLAQKEWEHPNSVACCRRWYKPSKHCWRQDQ